MRNFTIFILVLIVLSLAITYWPVTLVISLIVLLVVIIKYTLKRRQSKKLRSKKDAAIPKIRSALIKDRLALTTKIVEVIRKHWDVLEDKFEDNIYEDDYGTVYLQKGIKKEFDYFTTKLIIPDLLKHIDKCENSEINLLKNSELPTEISEQLDTEDYGMNSLAYILQDTIYVLQNLSENYFDISYTDSDEEIAGKILSAVKESTLSDDSLYILHLDQQQRKNYQNNIKQLLFYDQSITLDLQEKLKSDEPIVVSPFIGLIFILFSALYNSNKQHKNRKKKQVHVDNFIGNNPYEYEEHVKKLLRSQGFEARKTRSSGDYGVDVVASRNGVTYAIQCKLYNKTVGTRAVQEIFGGRVYYDADYAIVVSDNSFTDAAKSLAKKANVRLTHHNKLIETIEDIESNNKARI